MGNEISLKSISNLLGEHFFIPAYQRGYRWESQQVVELLEDISTFQIKHKTDDEYYCLQPIVVKSHRWTLPTGAVLDGWEVVDGQQRLTTISLLISYLIKHKLNGKSLQEYYKKDVFTIHYETQRNESFLTMMDQGQVQDIDSSYMQKAYSAISRWFMGQDSPAIYHDYVFDALVCGYKEKRSAGVVQVIWYEIEDGNAIETFLRINMGKIPLSSAELIKALFLEEKDYGDESDLSKIRQKEISCEWDVMENALHNHELWAFLGGNMQASNRIGIVFDLMCRNDRSIDVSQEGLGGDEYRSFRYFCKCIGSTDSYQATYNVWKRVVDEWNRLLDLFADYESYHYVGFLVQCGVGIGDIMFGLRDIRSKADIAMKLRGMIMQQFPYEIVRMRDGIPRVNVDYRKIGDREKIKKLLLLFNIEYIVAQCKNKRSYLRFPFEAYINGHWDIEHVDSSTENELRNTKDQSAWLSMVLDDFPKIDFDLKSRIEDFLQGRKDSADFSSLYGEIVGTFGIKGNDEDMKNSIGNLVLLDAGMNRAYGNALFATKRRFVIEKDKEGGFVPLCTKNVFLKYFNEDPATQRMWTEQDAEAYCRSIEESLSAFLRREARLGA
jgi:hypothetical protein